MQDGKRSYTSTPYCLALSMALCPPYGMRGVSSIKAELQDGQRKEADMGRD